MTPDAPLYWAAARRAADGPPDATLLTRFRGGDQEAFALLVGRHGPMVYGVCRRVAGPDADDAFQAVFLVLARRAAGLAPADLCGWLYAVAVRTAKAARTARQRRHRRETPTHPLPDAAARPDPPESEVERELARLPERYRLAVALCLVDGRSRSEAAKLLGIPEGTLSSRLAEGRRRLADRLTRVGVAVVVPAAVQAGAVRAAVAGSSPAVSSLASGVLRAMTTTKRTVWAAGLATAAAVTLAVAGRAGPEPAADERGAGKQVADAPAVVVKTVPEAGGTDVDPGLTEVRVTYSKPMTDGSWSWSTNYKFGLMPDVDEGRKLGYEAKPRTFTLPVKLKPGQTYALQLNSEQFGNFRDAGGRSALPYLLVFGTRGAK